MKLVLERYLARIGYSGPVDRDFRTLREVHRRHLLAIAYENLDVQLQRPLTIEVEPIYEKIVLRRRGGWCFEMNGLLAWALSTIGFSLTQIAAGVMREERGEDAFGNHLALIVHLERDYLADVGFGDGLLEPVPLAEDVYVQGPLEFRLQRLTSGEWRFLNHPEGGARSFDFALTPADRALLARKCAWLQSAAESPFVLNAVCQIHTPEGLAMLRGRSLKMVTHAGVTKRTVADLDEYRRLLRQVFRLEIETAEAIWARILARDAERLSSDELGPAIP
jgi:N-hydroxyarylamine O-acetyltransferase